MTEDQQRASAALLVAETGSDLRTALRWLQGETVNRTTDYAFRTAADKLGIAPPTSNIDAAAAGAA
jgi:hypothetical protein